MEVLGTGTAGTSRGGLSPRLRDTAPLGLDSSKRTRNAPAPQGSVAPPGPLGGEGWDGRAVRGVAGGQPSQPAQRSLQEPGARPAACVRPVSQAGGGTWQVVVGREGMFADCWCRFPAETCWLNRSERRSEQREGASLPRPPGPGSLLCPFPTSGDGQHRGPWDRSGVRPGTPLMGLPFYPLGCHPRL